MSVEGTPACCRKGVKSEPEPRSPTWTSSPSMGGAFEARCSLPVEGLSRHCWKTDPATGLGTERAMSRTNSLSEGTAAAEKSGTGDGHIDIEVGDGAIERAALLLDPFGGADEALLFGVPTAEDDGALGPPALTEQCADAVHGFKHGGGAAGGIDRAIDPGVAMIADDDPGVGILRALDFADHVPDDAALVVLLRDEVDFHSAGTQVIAERQRALPALRHSGAFERLQDRAPHRDS